MRVEVSVLMSAWYQGLARIRVVRAVGIDDVLVDAPGLRVRRGNRWRTGRVCGVADAA